MLQRLGEPYVYHVHKGNVTALERALKKAMSTPIDRSVVFKNGQRLTTKSPHIHSTA